MPALRPLALGLMLVLGAAAGSAWAEDAPPPPPAPFLGRLFLDLKTALAPLPPFLRDSSLTVQIRTYYLDRMQPSGTENEAWAGGGWLGYRSGWLLDTLAVGATIYGAGPLYAPPDKDGTLLLQPGQEGYVVLGEAYAALRYQAYALLTGFRQRVDQTYINSQDNRMTPNTFEGVTLGGEAGDVQYLAGYLWTIKPRNSDTFISMAEQAGAKGSDDGVIMAGVRITPMSNLRLDLSNQYGVDTFNTLYAEVDYRHRLTEHWTLRLGAQFTDQRAVGETLVANAAETKWSSQSGGARVQLIYRDLTLTGAFSVTASGNTIQAPWGSYPGYLALIDQDFNRASEKAWLFGASYDFSRQLIPGLGAYFNFAWGVDAINPQSRAKAPDQREYDLTIDYRPPWLTPPFLRGVWLRMRGDILDQQGADRLGYQVRVILNWERDLL